MKRTGMAVWIALAIAAAVAVASWAATEPSTDPMPWLQGLTLIELETDDIPSLHRALGEVIEEGGKVALMVPPNILIGWVPLDVGERLMGRPGFKAIHYGPLPEALLAAAPEPTRYSLRFFNDAVTGRLAERYLMRERAAAAAGEVKKILPDALTPDPIDPRDYYENLRRQGLTPSLLESKGLGLKPAPLYDPGNSDEMTGTISVTIFFVESNGHYDPDTYTWDPQDVQDYVNGVNAGLAFWSNQAYNYNDCWCAFMVHYYPPTDPRCQQGYEPVLRPSSDEGLWVNAVMSNFGYTSGSRFTKVSAFNTWQRSTYQTNWATSAFVAYNPPPAPTSFTDGYAAFTYYGGPYEILLFRSFGWPVEQVFTHETGHVFYACDEYYSPGYGGCTSCGPCAHGVDNGNCEYCGPGRACMMNANDFTLCEYTPGHVGWFISPCAPPPLSPPTVSSVSPTSQYQALSTTLLVVGSNFAYGTSVDLGPDIVVNNSTYVSPETVLVDITVLNEATPGLRDVIVYNRDMRADTLPNGFEVLPTTRHYFSPAGTNEYPYMTPSTAATDLSAAVNVLNDGDTLFIASGTYSNVDLAIGKAAYLMGAWSSDFTSRDLGAKTVFQLSKNVSLIGGTGTGGFDGIVFDGGLGDYWMSPYHGYYGGALFIKDASVVIKDCEILNSRPSANAADSAFGGGIACLNSTVHIESTLVQGNSAWFGGGIFLHQCSATLVGNRIVGNSIGNGMSSVSGAGLYVMSCSDVTLQGNVIESNTGASDGGGVAVVGTSR
jgi:hypothetical protein